MPPTSPDRPTTWRSASTQVCKYYYWPGVHKQGAIQQMLVSKAKYDALPDSLKRVITVASQASHQDMLAEYNWLNANALNDAEIETSASKRASCPTTC